MSHTEEEDGVDTADAESVFNRVAKEENQYGYTRVLRDKINKSLVSPILILLDDWRGAAGIAILSLYVFLATVGVRLVPEPGTDTENIWVVPFQTWQYPLGTDSSGKGVLAETIHATPPMMKMIVAGGIFAIIVGALVGILAGYRGGLLDQTLMIIADTLMTLPGLPLVIVIAFIFEPSSPYLVGILLAINNWSGLARSIRSQVLATREENYIEASSTMGIRTHRILLKDLLPPLMPYIAVNFVGAARAIIFESVALYFLGVLPTGAANWGVMMNTAYSSGGALYSWEAVHWLLVPMGAIVLLSLGMILLSQAADKLFNPRIRAKYEKRQHKSN